MRESRDRFESIYDCGFSSNAVVGDESVPFRCVVSPLIVFGFGFRENNDG